MQRMDKEGKLVSPEEREWSSSSSPENKPKSVDMEPDFKHSVVKQGMRPGDSYVRVGPLRNRLFRKVGPGRFVATRESDRPATVAERGYRAIKRVLIGRPLETAEEIHQRLSKVKALAIFGSDAISSSAYATEAALVILMVAGNGALGISFYTAVAIAIMLSIVAFSYRQTVYAYPQGGGSYNVGQEAEEDAPPGL